MERELIYAIIKEYCPEVSEPKKLCSTIQDYAEDYNKRMQQGSKLPIHVVMPRELTAENGAKSLLVGEFKEQFEAYDSEEGEYVVDVIVSWTTIKDIYKKIVAHYEA
jgi:hypothetical protein